MIRAVLFDLDHTLFDTARTEARALARVARESGIPLGRKAVDCYQAVNTHVWGEYRAGRLTSKELRVRRFELWLRELGHDIAPAPSLARRYLDAFSSRGDLISGAKTAVRSVAGLGLKLGVVTNGIDKVQRRRLRASDLTASFPVVVTSERAGFTKPDPRIIEIALKRLKVRPDETVYVGDDPQVDGLAANRASVAFIWFNPNSASAPEGAGVSVAHEVHRLGQIRDLVRPRW